MSRVLSAIRRLRAARRTTTAPNSKAAAAAGRAFTLLEQARAAEARDNLGARVAVSPISRKPAALPGHELPPVIPVEPASARPGDIAVFADHTAIVAGHGHLIGHPGRLSDQTGPGLQGVFRVA